MPLADNLLVAGIFLAIFILVYCKMKNKTLPEFTKEVREALSTTEEVYE